ncbi:hypothetical protein CDL15_Pgr012646 [Punica granatum]|uniref:Uncharacterized protein n=1 Tax=Punica granatum TaxID=22663 RepID=A0A218WS21_PUNGR|nr:hypothetical protein CDL15_Pgr012646 [Punica granatum]
MGEELGQLEKPKRAVRRTNEQGIPKTTELALWHYSSPSHRSTERCPIWDSKNPFQCQSDQRHVRTHFQGIPHKPGHPDLSRTPFLTGLAGPAPLTSKQPPETGLQAPRTAPQNRPTGTQGPPKSGNKLQMTFRNSTRFPEGRFSGHERLPASLWGTSTENRDHNDPRAPQDIQGTLRKPRSKVPRSSRADGLRPGTTSQQSPTGHMGHQNECQDAQRAIGDRRALNSAPNIQTRQNRLSRRRVARTFVHTTHGDIRLIQVLVVQAFQIYKSIGHRRSDASSIKFQAFFGFSLNRMGPTAQPSQATKPRLNPKPRLNLQAAANTPPAAQSLPQWLNPKSFPQPHIQNIPYTSSHQLPSFHHFPSTSHSLSPP